METQQIHDPLSSCRTPCSVSGEDGLAAVARSSSNPYATPSNARRDRTRAARAVFLRRWARRHAEQTGLPAKKAAAARRAVALLVFAITLPFRGLLSAWASAAAAGLEGQS